MQANPLSIFTRTVTANRVPFWLLLFGALFTFAAACAKEEEPATLPNAQWVEDCNACGMEWTVAVSEGTRGGGELVVNIRNTGERGRLQLRIQELELFALNPSQASSWQRDYPLARANRNALDALETNGYTTVKMRFVGQVTAPIDIAPLSTYTATFIPVGSRIPADTAGLILRFGPVVHERSPAGLPATDNWITWDSNRPFIGMNGDVRVTPVTLTPTQRPATNATPRPPAAATPRPPAAATPIAPR